MDQVIDLKALLVEREDCDAGTIQKLREGLAQGGTQFKALKDVNDTLRKRLESAPPALAKKLHLKLGITNYFLGHMADAVAHLKEVEAPLGFFYLGKALVNRHQYDDALKILATLRERYPRNRLVWLESGSTALRAGRAADAERFLSDGLARFADDRRPRMFGEDALLRYKRGAALAGLGRNAEAEADLRKSLALEGRKWVHARSHLELGKIALKTGNKTAAVAELRAAIPLADSDNDPLTSDEARRLLK